MENSANIMRIALIVSIIAHVLFVTFSARDLRASGTNRAGDQPELLAQNFAVGEIPLAVTLAAYARPHARASSRRRAMRGSS